MKSKTLLSCLACSILLLSTAVSAQVMMKDIFQVPCSDCGSTPYNFTKAGNNIFFIAKDVTHGYELWKTDGTESGTMMVKDINPLGNGLGNFSGGGFTPELSPLIPLGDKVIFFANDYVHGTEPWVSDGTDGGTFMLKDLDASSSSSIMSISTMILHTRYTVANGKIFFEADTGISGEVWVTDGTSTGTVSLNQLTGYYLGNEEYFITDGSFAYFNSLGTPQGIWKSDGTATNTTYVGGGDSVAYFYGALATKIGNKIFFISGGVMEYPGEPYVMDDAGNFSVIKDINQGSGGSVNTIGKYWGVLDGKFYFAADDIVHGSELWVTDGTNNGTYMLKELRSGLLGSTPSFFIEFNGELYFVATNDSCTSLYKTDGTSNGTVMVNDPNHYTVSGYESLYVAGNYLFFGGVTPTAGNELWRTDGTDAGSVMLNDNCPGSCNFIHESITGTQYGYAPFFDGNSTLYFAADDGVHDIEPWILDVNSVGIGNLNSGGNNFTLFPNPAKDQFTFHFPNYSNLNIKLIDLFGREVTARNNINASDIRIERGNLASGLYSVVVTDFNQQILYSGKVIFE